MSTFRKISPPNDSANVGYMIGWLSPGGGVRSWFFASTKNTKTTAFKYSQVTYAEGTRSFPVSKTLEVKLFTENLDRDTFQYVSSIMESDYVFLIEKTTDLYKKKKLIAVKNGRVKEGGTGGFHDFAFTIVTDTNAILNS